MNKETFWKIMLDTNNESGGEVSIQLELIEKKLGKLSPNEIIECDQIYQRMGRRRFRKPIPQIV